MATTMSQVSFGSLVGQAQVASPDATVELVSLRAPLLLGPDLKLAPMNL
jgi:hypothetical protein